MGRQRDDQERTSTGQFGMSTANRPYADEGLTNVVSCKVTTQELRQFSILYDQFRKMFGWQTMSDMYRAFLNSGFKDAATRVTNPSKALLRMKRQAEELEKIQAEASKHRDLSLSIERVDRDVDETLRNGDFAGVRRMLLEFRANTELEDDPAIKRRRTEEYNKRWSRLDESLNRGASIINMEDDD